MTNALRLFAGVHVPPPRALVAAEHCSAAAAIWPEHPPVFTGPVALHEDDPDVGGGRGFVAAADLEPGDLLHVEAPLLAWSEEATHQPARMLQAIFDAADAPALLRAMRQLHPVQLTPCLREAWASEHSDVVQALLPRLQMLTLLRML